MSVVGGRAGVVWKVARDRQLLRLQLGFAGFAFAEHATWLAILVFAFERGGAREAGVVAVVQLGPAIVVTPFAAYAGDRFRPERVLAAGYAMQAVSMLATAAAMWADRALVAYAAGAVAATCITFSRPVMGAILPTVARTPNDLVAANVVTGFTEYVGMFVGPLIAAALLAGGSPASVFAVCAGITAASALLSAGLRLRGDRDDSPSIDARGVVAEIFGGLRAMTEFATLRMLVVLLAVGALTRGVNDVLMVLFADARLDGGGGSAGLLGAALGIGAVIGSVWSAGLIGRARLLPYLLASALLAAAPYFGLAGIEMLVPALAMFLLFGMAESLLRVTTSVGIQRSSPDGVLARIFGVAEGLQMALMAVGSLAVAVLVDAIGLNGALAIIGGLIALAMVVASLRFQRLGGDVPPPPDHVVARLLVDPVFEPLGTAAISRVADRVEVVSSEPGAVVITEGEDGDRYYLIVAGTVDVTIRGQLVRTMTAGDSFGEIALLRNVPRAATVTCATQVELLAISRDDFLETVTGHPRSFATASRIASDLVPD
jgi:Cyclic nucleotide-binding domain/Major Facilitator Superfamily